MPQVKVITDPRDDSIEVWLDCDQENYTGLCLATGTRRAAVIQDALQELARASETLRAELVRAVIAGDPL